MKINKQKVVTRRNVTAGEMFTALLGLTEPGEESQTIRPESPGYNLEVVPHYRCKESGIISYDLLFNLSSLDDSALK